MKRAIRLWVVVLTLVLVFCLAACGGESEPTPSDTQVSSEETLSTPTIKVDSAAVRSAEKHPSGLATVVEKLSLSPLTESSSFGVRGAVNYKWIAYDNYTVVQHFDEGLNLADGGYLFYIELPKTSFDHEMYFEFFAERDKVDVYSGEVAYTESDKIWYSLPLGASSWSEHITQKYKLCFSDGGAEYKGYVFIPADSLTYRNELKTLTDIGVYVKTGVETCNAETGNGIDFNLSTVMPVSSFDKTTVIAESDKGRVDLSKNAIAE